MTKTKRFSRIITFALAMLMVVAMAVPAFAATRVDGDYVDKEYYKSSISAGTWISTVGRTKINYSSVYVKPSLSPSGISKMQTCCNDNGKPSNKTVNGTVSLSNNIPYAIRNNILEEGDRTNAGVFMWLSMTPGSGAGEMKGVWSPDYWYDESVTDV